MTEMMVALVGERWHVLPLPASFGDMDIRADVLAGNIATVAMCSALVEAPTDVQVLGSVADCGRFNRALRVYGHRMCYACVSAQLHQEVHASIAHLDDPEPDSI